MKYRFTKQPVTKAGIEEVLGKKIKKLTVGQIDNGQGESVSGVEVETDETLTPAALRALEQLVGK